MSARHFGVRKASQQAEDTQYYQPTRKPGRSFDAVTLRPPTLIKIIQLLSREKYHKPLGFRSLGSTLIHCSLRPLPISEVSKRRIIAGISHESPKWKIRKWETGSAQRELSRPVLGLNPIY